MKRTRRSVVDPAEACARDLDRKICNSDSVSPGPEDLRRHEDRNEDPDWMYLPMLKGAFSTHPADYDGGKIWEV